ncbi:4931_t:CDS:1, partial [Entrophospora sp. SA101]
IYPDMERLDYFESLIDRFLQGNNPNSLIYVERTWGNYRNEIVRYLCHYHHHHQ